jgi:hypothetical protein
MAKKPTPSSRKTESAPAKASPSKAVSTPVRNSAIPKSSAASAPKAEITRDEIALRAYHIHLSGTGGSESDNWFRAERELRGL